MKDFTQIVFNKSPDAKSFSDSVNTYFSEIKTTQPNAKHFVAILLIIMIIMMKIMIKYLLSANL